MVLEGHSLADSTQDNGVCVQSGHFDYLVDLENHVIEEVRSGEIYVPVCYRQMIGLNVGETVQIGETDFTIAGFLRDSQMNAMMASSKRFLVSESDYHLLKKEGSEEYLIEFLLREETDVNAFATEYTDAGLPANGPAITKPLIRLMNALSDGLMILVILLVSVDCFSRFCQRAPCLHRCGNCTARPKRDGWSCDYFRDVSDDPASEYSEHDFILSICYIYGNRGWRDPSGYSPDRGYCRQDGRGGKAAGTGGAGGTLCRASDPVLPGGSAGWRLRRFVGGTR